MADDPPERISFSIPPDADLSGEEIEELVESGEYASRSELIREAISSLDPDAEE